MKITLAIIISVLTITNLYSQSHFTLLGKTNKVKNGKAILLGGGSTAYSLKIKSDTVNIFNHSFRFDGSIKYPEEHRIVILNTNYISEPFFVDPVIQKITLDSSLIAHDQFDFGFGVIMTGSKTNDEYFNQYLPLFKNLNGLFDSNSMDMDRCDSITDVPVQNTCMIFNDSVRKSLKIRGDSIILVCGIVSKLENSTLDNNGPVIL